MLPSIPRGLLLALLATIVAFAGCASKPPAPPEPAPVAAVIVERPRVVLPIGQIDRGVQIVLPDNVLFDFGKATLNEGDSGPYLDRIAVLLTTKTDKRISVEGHTDNIGGAAVNQRLSEQRADVVANALLARGVPAARVTRHGFSFTQPVAPNDVEAGRRLNRRTEVIVIDETVENITRGEPANAFEDAAARIRAALEAARGRN
jgi:outer membrane protein OmpA-like peptidoglycan-associated protein